MSSTIRCPVEISVAAQHERSPGRHPIAAAGLGAKAVEIGQLAGGRNFENNAAAILSTLGRGPIVVAVCALNQRSVEWRVTVRAVEGRENRKSLRLGAHRQAESDGQGREEQHRKSHQLHFTHSVTGTVENWSLLREEFREHVTGVTEARQHCTRWRERRQDEGFCNPGILNWRNIAIALTDQRSKRAMA